MENWINIFLIALLAVGMIVGLSALCAVALLGAGKRYHQKQVAAVAEKVLCCLPHTDCGACGYQTCALFAEEVAWQAERLPQCPYLSQQKRTEIEELLAECDAQLQARREADKHLEEEQPSRE